MERKHHYALTVKWTGNTGSGTSNYRDYERSHTIVVAGKSDLHGSSDPTFRGDKTKHNPEELLVASLAACHMLWYLHLCADAGIVITDYEDRATGTMAETSSGSGHFVEVTLHPVVTVSDESMSEHAHGLHVKANEMCYIANSMRFPVYHRPTIKVAQP